MNNIQVPIDQTVSESSLTRRKPSFSSQKYQRPTNPTSVPRYMNSPPHSINQVQPFLGIEEDLQGQILKYQKSVSQLQLQMVLKSTRYHNMLTNLNNRYKNYSRIYRQQSSQLTNLSSLIQKYETIQSQRV